MAINEHDNDKCGKTRTDRIAARPRTRARRPRDVSSPRAVAARPPASFATAAGTHQTRPPTARQTQPLQLRPDACEHQRYKRAATAHEDAANAHDRAAEAAERQGNMTHAIEHREAAAQDRSAACDDLSRSQQTPAARFALDQ
jgi:hypothetical protein